MLLTITLLILAAALILMFSTEAIKVIKKCSTIPGVAWILPVFVASYIIVYDDSLTLWVLQSVRSFLQAAMINLSALWPFKTGAVFVAKVALIMGLSFLPVYLLNVWQVKKRYVPLKHAGFATLMLWLFLVIMLSTVVGIGIVVTAHSINEYEGIKNHVTLP